LIGQIVARLTDADYVRGLVERAPAATKEILQRAAWEGPYVIGQSSGYGGRVAGPAQWALERGLLGTDGSWGAPLEMPAEWRWLRAPTTA
jgi:hypothetical protein